MALPRQGSHLRATCVTAAFLRRTARRSGPSLSPPFGGVSGGGSGWGWGREGAEPPPPGPASPSPRPGPGRVMRTWRFPLVPEDLLAASGIRPADGGAAAEAAGLRWERGRGVAAGEGEPGPGDAGLAEPMRGLSRAISGRSYRILRR